MKYVKCESLLRILFSNDDKKADFYWNTWFILYVRHDFGRYKTICWLVICFYNCLFVLRDRPAALVCQIVSSTLLYIVTCAVFRLFYFFFCTFASHVCSSVELCKLCLIVGNLNITIRNVLIKKMGNFYK
jgi:hypothetical protein